MILLICGTLLPHMLNMNALYRELNFQPAINMLLSLVRKDGKAEDGKKKKKEEGGILLRPIICICNDQ